MGTSAVATIKLFGMLKTLVPGGVLSLDFPPDCQVKDFIEMLRAQWPEVAELVVQKKVLISVNQEIAHWDTEISNSDEIALLPPFAGGSPGKV
ncbi:MAG: MoaD/ThiS family protein [Nitrospirales bacterium]|nr:MoaD/ThiS family protein [Nitrospirales bacterium]